MCGECRMKRWLLLSFLIFTQIWIIFFGINFKINVGDIQKNENAMQYMTTSRTIASFILASGQAEIVCENAMPICTQVINPESISPFMPIQLETCKKNDLQKIDQCHKAQLRLNLDTSKWIQTSLGRRL